MKQFKFYIWPGSGYALDEFIIMGESLEDAIDNLFDYLVENTNEGRYWITEDTMSKWIEEDNAEDNAEDYDSIEYAENVGFNYMDTGNYIGYLRIENMKIDD